LVLQVNKKGMQEMDFGDWMVSVASMSRAVNRVAPEIRREQVLQAEAY
jgi:hypothetical protein